MSIDNTQWCLPEEITQIILSYLSVRERLVACLVCKQWLNAMNCPKLLKHVSVNIYLNYNMESLCFTRCFSSFTFYKLNISTEVIHFLIRYGESIRVLTLKECSMQKELIDSISQLILCHNLTKLEFYNCFFDIFHYLPVLKVFKIIGDVAYTTDHNFLKWIQIMPKLKNLVMKQPICCTEVRIREIYSYPDAWLYYPSRSNLTLPVISLFIEKLSKTLTNLEIANPYFQLNTYPKLFRTKDLKLKSLVLHNNLNYSMCYDFVTDICKNQTTLVSLDLSCCLEVDDDVIKSICTLLPGLQILYVENNYGIDSSVEYIFQLKSLRYLSLSQCSNITRHSFRKALNVFQSRQLRTLDLHSIDLDDDVLRNLLIQMPQLRYLDIGNCDGVSNETVQAISENLVYLRYLELSFLSNVTDEGIYVPGNPEKSITNIKGLRHLYLDGTQVSPHGFIVGVKFRELRKLGVQQVYVTIEDFENKLRKQNPSLKSIFTY